MGRRPLGLGFGRLEALKFRIEQAGNIADAPHDATQRSATAERQAIGNQTYEG